MKKIITIITILILTTILMGAKNYNYSYYGEVISSSPGMTFQTFVDSRVLGIELGNLEDLKVYDEKIYIIDSTLGKIIILNKEYELIEEKMLFEYSTEFIERKNEIEMKVEDPILLEKLVSKNLSNPMGIDITENGIFVADTKNSRVLKLNFDFEIVNVFFEESEVIIEDLTFEPSKITVDSIGRMYIVVNGAHEGIIELANDGRFNRFVGTNTIKLTPLDNLKRLLMSEEQKKNMTLELSTSFTNVNINERGFIFATAKPTKNNSEEMIQLLNPKGTDVLKRNGYHIPMGDVNFLPTSSNFTDKTGPSALVDVAYTKNGIYSVLDQKRSRIFTYDQEGNLLYVNGESSSGTSTQNDKLEKPVALDYIGDDLIVLDSDPRTKKIVVFSLTDFGTNVNNAIEQHTLGNFEDAALIWEEVLRLNTNYEIAYNGIGKSLLRQKKYKEAMRNFKLGHDQFYYSKAFKSYRNDIIKENFGWIVSGVIVIVAVPIGFKIKKLIKNRRDNK